MKYVVLLRGVNVGGKRRVPKEEFKMVLENLGFSDVVIYINSGNAILTSDAIPNVHEVQTALEQHFGFDIATLILNAKQVQDIANAIPAEWVNDPLKDDKSGQKSDVLYLFDDVNSPDILTKLGYNPTIETMIYLDGAVLTNISRANQMKSNMQKIVGTKLYTRMTIRNVNTARKLAELVV